MVHSVSARTDQLAIPPPPSSWAPPPKLTLSVNEFPVTVQPTSDKVPRLLKIAGPPPGPVAALPENAESVSTDPAGLAWSKRAPPSEAELLARRCYWPAVLRHGKSSLSRPPTRSPRRSRPSCQRRCSCQREQVAAVQNATAVAAVLALQYAYGRVPGDGAVGKGCGDIGRNSAATVTVGVVGDGGVRKRQGVMYHKDSAPAEAAGRVSGHDAVGERQPLTESAPGTNTPPPWAAAVLPEITQSLRVRLPAA